MKALQLVREQSGTKPELSLVTLPKPKVTPGHLLVRVHAAAIHPSDRMNILGAFTYTTYPRIPGRDFAGIIEDGPPDRIGEEVYGTSGYTLGFSEDGTYAEFCLVQENAVARKPKSLSFAQAARIGVPFTTAALALRRGETSPSDIVFVIGAAGTVGSAVVQLAKGMGCQVVTASRHDTEDINTASDPTLEKITSLTKGHGIDVIIDTVGDIHLMRAAVDRLALRGRLSYITAPRSGSTELSFDLLTVYRKEQKLVGCNSLTYSAAELAAEMSLMTSKFESGVLTGADDKTITKVKLDDAVGICTGPAQRKEERMVILIN